MPDSRAKMSRRGFLSGLGAVAAAAATYRWWAPAGWPGVQPRPDYRPRAIADTSGYVSITRCVEPWRPNATLQEISQLWRDVGQRHIEGIGQAIAVAESRSPDTLRLRLVQASFFNYEGQSRRAYQALEDIRATLRDAPELATEWLYSVIYFQGVTALRCGETENCIHCRGPCSCIVPLAPAAVHTHPSGSRLALARFTEFLEQFPDDLEVRWLLNVAHMTLGEYPDRVDPRYALPLEAYWHSALDIGRFRDAGAAAGVDRLSMSGGAVLDDFDNDGLLDLVVTTRDPTAPMGYYHNRGDGTFEDRTRQAGLGDQLGGFNCVQTDYDNDGNLDLFVVRGSWLDLPIRPSLLHNNGDGTFTDVTERAGLLAPLNSACAVWADYDNDGFLDLFVCCERQPNRLYRNKGDGTFEEVAHRAGLHDEGRCAKGATWIDYDNDGWPDLFINNSGGAPAQLYHNNRDGTFTDVTARMGIDGPTWGFSCWAWDYNNDGWLDLFATSYERTLADVLKGMLGQPHARLDRNRLYRNRAGRGFEDVTAEVGLDQVFAAMGSNFGDFDNDGWLDFYLGTGDPDLAMLVPNRMFKNVAGQRFVDITSSSGTGHLQKGHGVACGDLRRTGDLDIFIQMGGVTNGDKSNSLLFLNPGHANRWLTVKLTGRRTNRPGIGARIKVVTVADTPLTIHRHVSSGSSFGGNPLQQTIGLGPARRIAELEIRWPTSGTAQTFRDLAVNQAIEVTEFARHYRVLNWTPVPAPGS